MIKKPYGTRYNARYRGTQESIKTDSFYNNSLNELKFLKSRINNMEEDINIFNKGRKNLQEVKPYISEIIDIAERK